MPPRSSCHIKFVKEIALDYTLTLLMFKKCILNVEYILDKISLVRPITHAIKHKVMNESSRVRTVNMMYINILSVSLALTNTNCTGKANYYNVALNRNSFTLPVVY